MAQQCFISRNEFIEAVGTVNAEISTPRTGVRYATKYWMVAERIKDMAIGIRAKVLHTTTDEGLYVVTVKGFQQ